MESSGGGFGDPLERDPARVAADMSEGYVTPEAAEAIYGVVLRDGVPTRRRRPREVLCYARRGCEFASWRRRGSTPRADARFD
jgi:N-methylhydantoinase B